MVASNLRRKKGRGMVSEKGAFEWDVQGGGTTRQIYERR